MASEKERARQEAAQKQQERQEAARKRNNAKYKAWREQYPDEPYHAGWDKGYTIKGFENDSPAGFDPDPELRRGGKVKKMAKGGSTASKRADGCATKGKIKGKFV